MSWKSLAQTQDTILFMDEIIQQIQKYDYQRVPSIAIYYQIYLTIIEEDESKHFEKLMTLIGEYIDLFPLDEARGIYQSALNYCIKKINKGFHDYHSKALDIYKVTIKKELLFIRGELSPTSFRNIISTALRLGEYSWAEKFIQNYKDRLNEKYQRNAVVYNLSRVYWYRKDYEKVIELLQEVEYEDHWYNLNSRALLLAVYYELDELEVLHSYMTSYMAYLDRIRGFPPKRKATFKNYIRFTRKLVSHNLRKDEKSIDKLETQIQETPTVNKPWLLEKLNELRKNPKPSIQDWSVESH